MTTFKTTINKPQHTVVEVKDAIVTVIVPVRNEEANIAHTLDQLLDQDLDGIEVEILVIDGQSTDKTREIVASYINRDPRINLLNNPRRLSSAARNVAIQESTGEYMVIIDGHCEIPSRRYFKSLVCAFEESGADCLGRPQPLDLSHTTSLQKAIASARSSLLGHHPESFIYSDKPQFVPAKSVAIAYRRDVFERVGLFDETFDAHEDGEFNYRCDKAGLRCLFLPELTVKYEPRKTLSGLFHQLFRYGRGRIRLFRKHQGACTLGTLMPAAFVLGTVLGLLLCLIVPAFWPVYLAVIVVYLGLIVLESVRLVAVSGNLRSLPWLPAVFFLIHFGSGCGLLWESLDFRKSRRATL